MLQYANNFTCLANENKETVVIHFRQSEPQLNDENGNHEISEILHDIASIVMDRKSALELAGMLSQIIGEEG